MTVLPLATPVSTRTVQNAIDAIDIHAISRPANFFTGDFYRFGSGVDGAIFALGDVAGKGLDAAIFMSMIQEILEQKLAEGHASCCLPQLVKVMDAEIGDELPSNRFVSLVLGHVSTDRSLQLVNAGHFPPLIRRLGGGIEAIASGGPVVGIHPAPSWTSHYLRMSPGDTLLLYTDGILETLSPEGEEYGLDRIADGLGGQKPEASAREIAESVFRDVARFRGRLDAHDDSTVMVVRF